MSDSFEAQEQSKAYAKHRYSVPPIVVTKIMDYLSEELAGVYEKALDVGCGTGQSTRILSPYFKSVFGVDSSETQLVEAKSHPGTPSNVYYLQGSAEDLQFEKRSFQLLTAGTSFHWFDKEKFVNDARTLLQGNGVLAIYFLSRPFIVGNCPEQTTKLRNLIQKNHSEKFSKYWDPRLAELISNVRSKTGNEYFDFCTMGFKDQRREVISVEVEAVPLNSIIEWERTMPEYYQLIADEGRDAATEYFKKLKQEISQEVGSEINEETKFRVKFICTLLMGRNN